MSGSLVEINDTGSSVSIGGSSLKGYINATYEELQAVFGSDIGNLPSDDIIGLALPKDDKVSSEFRFDCTVRYEDNPDEEEYVKGAIYSWKTDKIPQQIFTWNVGGYGQEAVWYAQDLLDAYRLTLTMEIA
jgi:hypothetical protein